MFLPVWQCACDSARLLRVAGIAGRAMSARFVFLVGFERCMTTMLAAYLVENRYCRLLVRGAKEPGIFSGHPKLARAIVERCRTEGVDGGAETQRYLDASVSYATNPAALALIAATCPEARIIVCLRDPLQRTLSAFRYYKALHALPIGDAEAALRRGTLADGTALPAELRSLNLPDDSWVKMLWLKYFEAFGSLPDWRTPERFDDEIRAQGDLMLPYLLSRPQGRYLFTAVVAAIEGVNDALPAGRARLAQLDAEIERFAAATLPQFILGELRHQRRHGELPGLSILRSSFYSYYLEVVFGLFAPSQVMIATMDRLPDEATTDARLRHFLGVGSGMPASFGFQRINDTARYAGVPDAGSIAAARAILEQPLREDARRVRGLIASHPGADLSLYSHEAFPE